MDIDIGLSQEQRDTIADGLGRLLADTYVLYGKTHDFTGMSPGRCSTRCT